MNREVEGRVVPRESVAIFVLSAWNSMHPAYPVSSCLRYEDVSLPSLLHIVIAAVAVIVYAYTYRMYASYSSYSSTDLFRSLP